MHTQHQSEWIFQQPEAFWLLLLIPLAIGLFIRARRRRLRALAAFADSAMLGRIAPAELRSPWLRLALASLALAAMVCALARPVNNPHPKEVVRHSRDLVFVLDVSRSMFAEDCRPNRLDAARLAIADCVAALPHQRVGLVVFAGTAAIKCPLTSDRIFFNELLDRVGPADVSHGGTLIRDALLKTTEKLLSEDRAGYQDVILITDGGSHEADPSYAVDALDKVGARLICVGIGSDRQGVRIPADDGGPFPYLMHENREVRTRLEADYLRQIAADVKAGVYLHVGTRTVDLADVYSQIVASDPTLRDTSESIIVYDEQYRVFAAAAAILVVLLLLPGGTRSGLRRAAPLAALLLLTLVPPGWSQEVEALDEAEADPAAAFVGMSPRAIYNSGNDAYRRKDYLTAVAAYRTAAANPQFSFQASYNLGNAHYQIAEQTRESNLAAALQHVAAAVQAFRSAAAQPNATPAAFQNLELSVRLRSKLTVELAAQEEQEQQSQQQQQSDTNDNGEEGDPDEGENSESSEGDAQMQSMAASDADAKFDLQAEGTPPPNVDPQQVLQEERRNNARRAANGKNRSPGNVEKDW